MGRHHKPTEPSFLSKMHLPSREAVAKFGIKAGVVAGLGLMAILGAKQMYDVSTLQAPATAGESFNQLDDKFWGIAKGAGLFAVATLGSVGFVARLSSVRHRSAGMLYQNHSSLFDEPVEEVRRGRHAAVEPEQTDELILAGLDFTVDADAAEPTHRGSHRLDDTLTDLDPVPAAA